MPYKNPEDQIRYTSQWRKDNKERINSNNRRWRRDNPEKYRATQRKCRTGWTKEEFEVAWTKQGGCCGICGREMLKTGMKSNSVAADHDHQTERTRGLLCFRCNSGLDFYERFHQQCAVYLDSHR